MLKWLHAYVLSCETLMTTSHVQSVTCLRTMLEVCFSCELKIIAQVRSATVVLRSAPRKSAWLRSAPLHPLVSGGSSGYGLNEASFIDSTLRSAPCKLA